MVFNSIPFLVFIVLFFLVWARLKKNNSLKWLWIILASFLFYAWWDWRFLFILIATGVVDFFAGKKIQTSEKKSFLWLWISLSSNIISLIFFKYSPWICKFLDSQLNSNLYDSLPEFSLVVPVGISFYTFNSMSYTIDIYRKKVEPARNILHFFSFIAFFPHLVAGPIIRAKDILGQLTHNRPLNSLVILNGIKTCIWGFFQKMVLADNLAIYVNEHYSSVHSYSDSFAWWICIMAFSFQIYFDFNGYSTIARGIAKLCGIHFKLNFNQPYLAHSFKNFWQRWHISLSSFFKDYVYKSLGGNRQSKIKTEINRWITMLISGLWHGANFTFIVWGALHAAFLTIESQIFKRLKIKFPHILIVPIIFLLTNLSWVFFRANDINDATYVFLKLFEFNLNINILKTMQSNVFLWLIISLLIVFLPKQWFQKSIFKTIGFQSLLWAFLCVACVFLRGPEQQFIYFQF